MPKTADQLLAQGQTVADSCRVLEDSQHTHHRWGQLYGGMMAEEANASASLSKRTLGLKGF